MSSSDLPRLGRTTGLPCAMVLTVSFVLSSGTGLSCPRRPRACQSSRAWPQRREAGPTRLRRPRRHRSSDDASRPSHPALNVRDDASAPLMSTGRRHTTILFRKTESEYFYAEGLTVESILHRVANIRVFACEILVVREPVRVLRHRKSRNWRPLGRITVPSRGHRVAADY